MRSRSYALEGFGGVSPNHASARFAVRFLLIFHVSCTKGSQSVQRTWVIGMPCECELAGSPSRKSANAPPVLATSETLPPPAGFVCAVYCALNWKMPRAFRFELDCCERT